MLPLHCVSILEQVQAIVRDYVAEKKKVPVCSIFYVNKDSGFHVTQFPEDVTESSFFTTSISFANSKNLNYFISVHTCKLLEDEGKYHLPRTRQDLNNEEASVCAVILVYIRTGKDNFSCRSLWAAILDEEKGILNEWDEYDYINFQQKN